MIGKRYGVDDYSSEMRLELIIVSLRIMIITMFSKVAKVFQNKI